MVRQREELVHRLRVGVEPALLGRRPVDPARVLGERTLLAVVAVDLGGRGDQHALAEAVAVLEHGLGALHVRDERAHRLLDDQAHADRGGEVVDDVALVHELAHDRGREHRVDDQVVVAPVAEMLDVRGRARGEVVEREHLPPVGEEQLREVGADEAGTAGDEGAAAGRLFARHGAQGSGAPRRARCERRGAAPRRSGRAARLPGARRDPPRGCPSSISASPSRMRSDGEPGSRSIAPRRAAMRSCAVRASASCASQGSTASGSSRFAASSAPGSLRSSAALVIRSARSGGTAASAATTAATAAPSPRRARQPDRPAGERRPREREDRDPDRRERPDQVDRRVRRGSTRARRAPRRPRRCRPGGRARRAARRARTARSAKPTSPVSKSTSSGSEWPRVGASTLVRSRRYSTTNPRAPTPASQCSGKPSSSTRQKS